MRLSYIYASIAIATEDLANYMPSYLNSVASLLVIPYPFLAYSWSTSIGCELEGTSSYAGAAGLLIAIVTGPETLGVGVAIGLLLSTGGVGIDSGIFLATCVAP